MKTRLVFVLNPLPLVLRKSSGDHWTTERSSGCLASAMDPVPRKRGVVWIAQSGSTGEDHLEERQSVLRDWARGENCTALDLPTDVLGAAVNASHSALAQTSRSKCALTAAGAATDAAGVGRCCMGDGQEAAVDSGNLVDQPTITAKRAS